MNLWYFAHPYSVKDADGRYVAEAEEANFDLCNQRAARQIEAGYLIYSPISHSHPIHRASPTMLARYAHQEWYLRDMEFVKCVEWQGIILAPGWNLSPGCRMEQEWFRSEGLEVREYDHVITDEGGLSHVVKMTIPLKIEWNYE